MLVNMMSLNMFNVIVPVVYVLNLVMIIRLLYESLYPNEALNVDCNRNLGMNSQSTFKLDGILH